MPRTNFTNGIGDGRGNGATLAARATVARTDTSPKALFTLPAGAQIVNISVDVPVVSNAATTATVSVGVSGGSNSQFSTGVDVKSAAGKVRPTTQAQVANWGPLAADTVITGTYAETGTASTAGGPFAVVVEYVL